MGHPISHLFKSFLAPFVDSPHVRGRPRCAALVPDAVGRLGHGVVGAVGWLTTRRRASGQDPLAMARHPRRYPRRRLRHDPPPDADPFPRHLHPGLRASPRIHRHHRRSRLRPRRHRSGTYFPQPRNEPTRVEERVVLDWIAGAARRVCGLLPLVQEGAIDEALSVVSSLANLPWIVVETVVVVDWGVFFVLQFFIRLTNCLLGTKVRIRAGWI